MPEVSAEEYEYLLKQKEKDHNTRAKEAISFYRNVKIESTCLLCDSIKVHQQDVLITSLPYLKPKTPDLYMDNVPTCSNCVDVLSSCTHNQLIIQMKSMSRKLNRQPLPKKFKR